MTWEVGRVEIDGDQPFNLEQECAYFQRCWPNQSGYLIVTGCYTRALTWHQGALMRKGGEAFPVAAPASLARLGLWLVQEMLQAVERVTPLTPLSQRLFVHFGQEIDRVIDWSKQAEAPAYAALAQAVLAAPNDPLSVRLLARVATELTMMINAVPAVCASPVTLSGALAQACLPYLPAPGEAACHPS